MWSKAVRRAAEAWRIEHELGPTDPTPFEWLDVNGQREWITTHDLRATAVTLMREVGMPREEASERVGHVDGGKLVADVYDRGDRTARVRRALDEVAPNGLRAALA